MIDLSSVFSCFLDPRFILFVFIGAAAGTFVGAIPGLSVTMATALLVSITYSWETELALATMMGVYVVGVFSGAISAILINIPGAPSSVVTTLDGYPMAKRGEAYKALKYAAVYSFIGTVFGILVLWVLAKPVTSIAIKFRPMDYFLLALFGLATVGSLTSDNFTKGLISAAIGLFFSMIGADSVVGTPRLTFGIRSLQAGVSTVPALVGLFGFAEVLCIVSGKELDSEIAPMERTVVKTRDVLKHFWQSLYYSTIGVFVGALPGAGGPVASFLAYSEARRIVKNPSRPFGEGAPEGIVASESANNAVIGGALIPMLTLAIPGDATTAVMLSAFYIHGLRPGPTFLMTDGDKFGVIIAAALMACVFLLLIGLGAGPYLSQVINAPKKILMPVVTVLCIVGAYACSSRLFDVGVMFFFGILGYLLRSRQYPIAPVTLGLVLGPMMDSNFRRAVSLAASEDNFLAAMLGYPITIILLIVTVLSFASNIPAVKRLFSRKTNT